MGYSNENIGSVEVDPQAEPRQSGQSKVPPGKEEEAYEEGRRQFELEKHNREAGWLGKFFGCGGNASTNIAGLLASVALLAFITSLLMPNPPPGATSGGLLSVATTALGYLFGRSSK